MLSFLCSCLTLKHRIFPTAKWRFSPQKSSSRPVWHYLNYQRRSLNEINILLYICSYHQILLENMIWEITWSLCSFVIRLYFFLILFFYFPLHFLNINVMSLFVVLNLFLDFFINYKPCLLNVFICGFRFCFWKLSALICIIFNQKFFNESPTLT